MITEDYETNALPTCRWLHPVPSCTETESESRMLSARSAAAYLTEQLQRSDLTEAMRQEIAGRIERFRAVEAEHAAIIKKLQGAR